MDGLKQAMDDLKQAKEKFEKEWKGLHDKRSQIKKEQRTVLVEKKYLENLLKEKFEICVSAGQEYEVEKYRNEKIQLFRDFELRKQQLETEMGKRQEDMERRLREKEKAFEEGMKVERGLIEKEKLEISENKKRVEEQQFEMMKDVEELVVLSQKLKDQIEVLVKERVRFIAFAENQKGCDVCGEKFHEFMVSDINEIQCDNGNADISVYTNNESIADSALGGPKNRRNRDETASENHSEGCSDDNDRPKRRQRVAAVDQNFGQNRSVAISSQGRKSERPSLETYASHNIEASREEIQQVFGDEGGDNPVRSEAAASAFSAPASDEDNVIGTGSQEYKTESDNGDDDDEVDHPGQASIGKKLWTFLIT